MRPACGLLFALATVALLLRASVVAETMKVSDPQVALRSEPSFARRAHSGASYKVVYRFKASTDGATPLGLIDVNGTLYGTTQSGGGSCGRAGGCGIVFSVSTTGRERVLHSFRGGTDGVSPEASLIDVSGTLYGTTEFGGGLGCSGNGCGTVFSVSTMGAERALHSFSGNDGAEPHASLIDVNGVLYGTTAYGGGTGCSNGYGCGTVFSMSMTGRERVLYRFRGGSDGVYPNASLIGVNGVLYGITLAGGASGNLTVFSVSTTGRERVLHSFRGGTHGIPYASLIDVRGTLYGTTQSGGGLGCRGNGCGTVFSMSTTGRQRVLYRFRGGKDGAAPAASLIDVNGVLYGTTLAGGANGRGTVFSLSTTAGEHVLHSFGGANDGVDPNASLIDVHGTLYGTTFGGGGANSFGTVFALTP